ncbi:MAG TPA: hypothetical protein EYQ86_05240, partial [Bacteroidetes bacterium]|nr:hypothetical protein [Bacteroidota bacterium]
NMFKKAFSFQLSFLFLLSFNINAQQPVMDWFKLIGGNGDNVASEMGIDGAGNIYVVGAFSDSLDFDPDSTTSRVLHSGGGRDAYILKLDPDGNLLWVKQIEGQADNWLRAIFVDDNGNSYTTGYFSALATLDTAIYQSADSSDCFIQKRNTDGDLIWTRTMGGQGDDQGMSISVDFDGNVYTAGTFSDTNKIANTTLVSNGMSDMFITKHDSLGNFVWAHNVGGIGDDSPNGIKVVNTLLGLCLYISAGFSDTVDFYGVKSYASAGDKDIVGFMIYASTGTLASTSYLDYVARMGGSEADLSMDFVFDDDLNIYSTGFFKETADLNPKDIDTTNYYSKGFMDAFVLKMNQSAEFQWALQFGSKGLDIGNAIGIDESGNIYTAGQFSDTIEFYVGSDTIIYEPMGMNDLYINKISPSGNLIWLARLSGDSLVSISSIKVLENGDILLLGNYKGGFNFLGNSSNSYGSIGGSFHPHWDMFILKLNQRYGISGLLLDSISNGIDSGMVYLIELNLGVGADTLERVYTDTAGRFHFNFVDTGSYIMKADATEEHPTTMPTYYPNAFYWYDAEIFELASDTSDIKIDILYTPTPPTPANGSGRIWGRLVEGTTFRGPSDPIDSIVIGMIRPDVSNDVYMLDTTDIDGYFVYVNENDSEDIGCQSIKMANYNLFFSYIIHRIRFCSLGLTGAHT